VITERIGKGFISVVEGALVFRLGQVVVCHHIFFFVVIMDVARVRRFVGSSVLRRNGEMD
jgi:hypothetical protein